MSLKRIILHWTAGADGVNSLEKDHYNFIVSRTGEVSQGEHPPEHQTAERIALGPAYYAAHTLHCNTDSIGVAMDAMGGATEFPFSTGKFPITEVQMVATAKLVAMLAVKYGIIVGRTTVLSHAEVQGTLGIQQKNKWDITWLPKMLRPAPAVEVGDMLRDQIKQYITADGMISLSKGTTLAKPIIRKGSVGALVEDAQTLLIKRGYDPGDADGLFGRRTDTALRQFQKDRGLVVDGIIGVATWEQLKREN